MGIRCVVYVLAACLLLSHFGDAARGVLRNDGSEYAVKTINTEEGDVYDCVDFYKQPAFNHPLLENHNFHPQMRPTFIPRWVSNNNSSLRMNEVEAEMTPLQEGGCPLGTVPIRRMSDEDDHFQTKVLQQLSAEVRNTSNGYTGIGGKIFAITQTKYDPYKFYKGAGATITVYNPRALSSQYSSGEVILRSGSDAIIVGWTVNPDKYKDTQTRLFIYAVAGDQRCFNSECGFIIVRTDFPLDAVMKPISTSGGKIFIYRFFVFEDTAARCWWLQVGYSNPIILGFWPTRIFEGLKKVATYAACGGEVYTSENMPPPEMGAGAYPTNDHHHANMTVDAYCRDFDILDEAFNTQAVSDYEAYANLREIYGVIDGTTWESSKEHVTSFGGPGS